MPTRKSTLARKTVARTYLSDVSPALSPAAKAGIGLLVERPRLRQSRLSILRHVGRAPRRVGIRLGLGGAPGLERDPKGGAEATLRERHRLPVVDGEGGEPCLEGRAVEVANLDRLEVRPVGLRPRGRGSRQTHAGLGAPLRRRVAGPRRQQRDDREEDRLDDRDVAIPAGTFLALAGVLPVLRDLLADLLWR